MASLREGKRGRECRGEEHVVELVRNKSSGKIRIYWNSNDISRYFRQRYFPTDSSPERNKRKVEYAWRTRSDEEIRIVGSMDKDFYEESIKFDLYVDRTIFKELPTVAQLGTKAEQIYDPCSPLNDASSQRSFDSSIATNELCTDQSSELEQGFRLSMVGLDSMTSGEDETRDELHSDLYSNSLTMLRNQIVSCLPQTEEIVSRAIINAFFVESQCSAQSYQNMEEVDYTQIEVDFIFRARAFVSRNISITPRSDSDDLTLQFLQECVDRIFLTIRKEEINSDEAARIVMSVATILGLESALDVAHDTITLEGIPLYVSKEHLRQILSQFGEIDAISICLEARTFAYCRYVFEESVLKATAAFQSGDIFGNNLLPAIKLSSVFSPHSNQLNLSIDELNEYHAEKQHADAAKAVLLIA
jgi:RNA recognition motif. (a.k.a. RRM, RBD, or RNP domain)